MGKGENSTIGWLTFICKSRTMQFLLRGANLKVFMILVIAFLFIPIIDPVSVGAQRQSKNPSDVAVDSTGSIYVIYNQGLVANNIHVVATLSAAGVELMRFGSLGVQTGSSKLSSDAQC